MRLALLAISAVVLSAACGSPPDPVVVNAMPSASSSAARATPPNSFDAGLPNDPILAASLDLAKLAAVLPGGDLAVVLDQLVGQKGLTSEKLGIDPARPILFAEMGPTAEQHALLDRAAAITDPSGAGKKLIEAVRTAKEGRAFRIVVPAKDAGKTKAAIALFLETIGLEDAGDGTFSAHYARAVVTAAGNDFVVDFGLGAAPREAIDSVRALVASGHATAPALDGRAFHAVYKTKPMLELSMTTGLVEIAGAISGESVEPAQRDRIAMVGIHEALGVKPLVDAPMFDQIDISARVDGKKLTVETRGELSKGLVDPPPTAWKDGPSITGDGVTGVVSATSALVVGFRLPGETAGKPLSDWPLREAVRNFPIAPAVSMLPALPTIIARLVAHLPALTQGALDRFERGGYLLRATGVPTFFGLLPKELQGKKAECVLDPAATTACSLKVDAVTELKPGRGFARLTPVAGSTALAVLFAEDKAAIATIKLTATNAPAFEMSLPRRLSLGHEVIDIPLLPEGGRISGTMTHDARAILLTASAP
ncbi:hypothetical protein BH09MYX1_BH09MYX1_49190 [soil metagenome]